MSEIALSLKNVSKKFKLFHQKKTSIYEVVTDFFKKTNTYEELQILDNVSLDIMKGEMFGIIGKNGMGKTTILKLIAKIYQPDSGTIVINGSIIPFLGIGAGFQGEMTAKDNVIMYGKLLGFSKKEIVGKLESILKFAELERYSNVKLKKFSAGMYARLAFATAIQVDPEIILMDEILAVGDIGFQKKSYDTFLSFKKRNKTIVVVTHDFNTIMNCDRVMLLDNGKIVEIGNPEQVYNKYKNLF